MAAVLKKRALAEYSQVVQVIFLFYINYCPMFIANGCRSTLYVQEEASCKPLQLTKKPRQASLNDNSCITSNLDKCRTNGEFIRELETIGKSLHVVVMVIAISLHFFGGAKE